MQLSTTPLQLRAPPGSNPRCSLCEALFTTLEEVTNHIQQVHRCYECNICFMRFVAEHQLLTHRQEVHELTNPGTNVSLRDPSDQPPELPTPVVDEGKTGVLHHRATRATGTPRSGERMEQGEPETPKKGQGAQGS